MFIACGSAWRADPRVTHGWCNPSPPTSTRCKVSVATKIFRVIAQFRGHGGCRGPKGRGSRCEAARAAIRFGGLVTEDVLKCTIAPEFGPKETPSSASFASLSPCHPQGACGGRPACGPR
jgi:hypothetical protein